MWNPKSNPPLYLRIDFGCCRGNTLDGSSYFLNEIEFAGCAIFTEGGNHKDVFGLWVKAYYEKAKEFETKSNKLKNKTKAKRRTRGKRKSKRKHR